MADLDLESSFCVAGSGSGSGSGSGCSKVVCEGALSDADYDECHANANADVNDPYTPVLSMRLRVGEDIEWTDLGAVLEREDSTKGTSNPKSATHRSATRLESRRLSACVAPKPPGKAVAIIGSLSTGKIAQHRRSCRLGRSARVFARDAVEMEPTSPKVSCFGGVRSDRRAVTPPADDRKGRWPSVRAMMCCFSDWCGRRRANELEGVEASALGDVKRAASSGTVTTDVGPEGVRI